MEMLQAAWKRILVAFASEEPAKVQVEPEPEPAPGDTIQPTDAHPAEDHGWRAHGGSRH